MNNNISELCQKMQDAAGNQPFTLSVRSLADKAGLTPASAHRRVQKLVADGVLVEAEVGTNLKAATYRYIGAKGNGASMESVKLDDIRIDGGTQPRTAIDENVVAEYAEAIGEGAQFPPVVIFADGVNKWLADGFHRYHSHRKAGCLDILADVRRGTKRDAVLYSVGANHNHGLRRTNADKRRAIETLLKDAEWGGKSNEWIASVCMVDPKTVKAVRDEHSGNPECGTVRQTRDGRTMDISNIGRREAAVDRSNHEQPTNDAAAPAIVASPEADRFGVQIPASLLALFGRSSELTTLSTSASTLKTTVEKAIAAGDGLYSRFNVNSWKAGCENLHRAVRFAMPYCVCRMCHGSPPTAGCRACRDTGWQTEMEHDALVPELRGA